MRLVKAELIRVRTRQRTLRQTAEDCTFVFIQHSAVSAYGGGL